MNNNVFEQLGFKMGYVKDTYDHRDHLHMPPTEMPEGMPPKFDLRGKVKTIFNQQYQDCSANVISNVVMSLQDDDKIVSRLFQYYNSRVVADPDFITDNGATYRDSLKALQKYGFVNEEVWEYTDEHVNLSPTEEIYQEGLLNHYVIKSYRKLYPTLTNIQFTLFSGHFIMFGIAIYTSFLHLDKNFVAPLPSKDTDTFCGLHAIFMCGYDNDLQAFLCVNSWGQKWGDNGWFYLPYKYVLDDQLAMDFWVIDTNYK